MNDMELMPLLDSVSHVAVQQYLRSRGWTQNPSETRKGIFAVYDADDVQVDVPLNPKLGDYRRRLHEAVKLIAAHESRSTVDLARALLEPAGDTVALRVATKGTQSGTLALADSIHLREAAKGLLLAAAHSEIEARRYYARLSRAPALEMLSSVREAQSAHGSFVSRFIVPTAPAVAGQTESMEEPFSRRSVRRLMQALAEISATRALGEYEPLLDMYRKGVSANLLRALASLHSTVTGGELEVSVAWAVNRPAPRDLPQSVSLPAEALEGLGAVAAAMRDCSETNGFELVGYVTRLERAVDQGQGVVSLFPTEAEGSEYNQVQLPLNEAEYAEAIAAHGDGAKVRVFGTLYKTGRVWKLKSVSGFERVPSEDEALAPLDTLRHGDEA